jgi:hypothetical protein
MFALQIKARKLTISKILSFYDYPATTQLVVPIKRELEEILIESLKISLMSHWLNGVLFTKTLIKTESIKITTKRYERKSTLN